MIVQLRRLGPFPTVKILKLNSSNCKKIWFAGRGTVCHIYTQSIYASRKHFSIEYRNNNYYITDLQSANGTFVNDARLVGEQLLNFGDMIGVGVPLRLESEPGCIVYVFEAHTNVVPTEKVSEAGNSSTPGCSNDLDDDEDLLILHVNLSKIPNIKSELTASDVLVKEKINRDVDEPLIQNDENSVSLNNAPVEKTQAEKTVSSDSLNDAIFAENSQKRIREPKPPDGVTSAKIAKLTVQPEKESSEDLKRNEVELKKLTFEINEDDAYNAPTQVDKTVIKTEPKFWTYSQTEELIEISDSEEEKDDDWVLKDEVVAGDEEDDDDDVVFVDTVYKSPTLKEGNVSPLEIEDNCTEVEKKLIRVKEETCDGAEDQVMANMKDNSAGGNQPQEHKTVDSTTVPDVQETAVDVSAKTVPEVSVAITLIDKPSTTELVSALKNSKSVQKNAGPRKVVSFNPVVETKFFDVSVANKSCSTGEEKLLLAKVVSSICGWNTVWLEECKKVAPDKDPLDIYDEPVRTIPRKFNSHVEYTSAFIPAMLMYIWKQVKNSWTNNKQKPFRQTLSCDSPKHYLNNLCVFSCTGVLCNFDVHKQCVREGQLVILNILQNADGADPKNSKKVGFKIFGLIESKVYEYYTNQPLHPALKKKMQSYRMVRPNNEIYMVRMKILVKKRPSFLVEEKKLISMTIVHRISFSLKMLRGICFLPRSPLCRQILKPFGTDFVLKRPIMEKKNFVFKGILDMYQKEIVSRLAYTCATTQCFMYSVHGAAGTGKTRVIIALILELLYGLKERPKIILCTHSRVPLDETVEKLNQCRQVFGLSSRFKMVRVGPIKEIKESVAEFCLSNLAKQCFESRKHSHDCDCETKILEESDVICTTTSSTGINKMIWAFEKTCNSRRRKKIICIMDEAMQIREPECTMPLLLGVSHLILFGDPYQSEPSFSGPKTHSAGLDTSLFWRLYKNFCYFLPKDLVPIYNLKTQYRMSPFLSGFLCRQIYNASFYECALISCHKISNLKSVHVFVNSSKETLYSDVREQETKLIFNLMTAILEHAKTLTTKTSIAIIAYDLAQVEALKKLMPSRNYPNVEINTVYWFQGREADVVVFSCDTNIMCTSQIAVALTRAKCSLFLLTSPKTEFKSENLWFRKFLKEAKNQGILKKIKSDMSSEEFNSVICHQNL